MRHILISDIHGCYQQFQQLLQQTQAQPHELYLLGDYVDSGPESGHVLYKVYQLWQEGATVLLGNHDDMFVNWVHSEEDTSRYVHAGGYTTISHLMATLGMTPPERQELLDSRDTANQVRRLFQKELADLLSWLSQLPLYHHLQHLGKNYLLVHAGVDPYRGLEGTERRQLLILREYFYNHYQGPDTVIFGHTRARQIHGKDDVYFGSNRIISIDGGCAFGGQLNALIMDEEGLSFQSVPGQMPY